MPRPTINLICAHCKTSFSRRKANVKPGRRKFCGLKCMGLARTLGHTPEEMRIRKNQQQRDRRLQNRDSILEKARMRRTLARQQEASWLASI